MSYLGDVTAVNATVGTLFPLSTPLVIQGNAECNGNFQVDVDLVLSGGSIQGGFGVNGDVYPFNSNINNLGTIVNYWNNFYANTMFLGGTTAVNTGAQATIVQPGDTTNPALILAGTGLAGGPTDTTNGACMFLNYNNVGSNVQWAMGDSTYIGSSNGMLRFISGLGVTAIDSMSGDGMTTYDVPFASSPVPRDDTTIPCGSATNRWSAVYAVNPVIQTSALDHKKDVQDSELGLAFINLLKPKSWTWKEIPNAKIDFTQVHHGFVFEDVVNVAPKNFGGVHDAKGKGTDGLSYTSFIAPLVKAIQELSAKVSILEGSFIKHGR